MPTINPLNSYFDQFGESSEIRKFFKMRSKKEILVQTIKRCNTPNAYNFFIAPRVNRIIRINFILYDFDLVLLSRTDGAARTKKPAQHIVQQFSERCYGDHRLGYMRLE